MARGDAAKLLVAGDHGTTYGGNPLCCAAASAVINTLSRDQLWDRADIVRNYILEGVHSTLADPASIREVRGLGLMIGIEPVIRPDNLMVKALEERLLINVAGGDTIRLLPPLVLRGEEAHEVGAIVGQLINSLESN